MKAFMKKTFQLAPEGKNPDRVLEATKHELRKYVRRERKRPLPEGADFWDFDCRIGVAAESARPVHLAELIAGLDALCKDGAKQVCVEILAKHGVRRPKPAGAPAGTDGLE